MSYEDPLTAAPLTRRPRSSTSTRARLREAFPDVAHRAHRARCWSAAATPASRGGCIGTQTGDARRRCRPPIAALTLHGLHYVELTDGRISRARGFFDLYEGAVQLGLLPQRGGLGEAALLMLRGFGLRPLRATRP